MRELKNARIWSNKELKKIEHLLQGEVINVSGELDRDKMGGIYKEYFAKANTYSISNYEPFHVEKEVILDLEKKLPEDMQKKWDVVFNHTVLEHIFDIRIAFANLCNMARKAVVIIVPFVQEVHYKADVYADYWRPTPLAIKRMFEENGFEMLYYASNNMEFTNTYLFCVGVQKEFVDEYAELDNRPHDYHAGKWVQKYGSEWREYGRIKQKVKMLFRRR